MSDQIRPGVLPEDWLGQGDGKVTEDWLDEPLFPKSNANTFDVDGAALALRVLSSSLSTGASWPASLRAAELTVSEAWLSTWSLGVSRGVPVIRAAAQAGLPSWFLAPLACAVTGPDAPAALNRLATLLERSLIVKSRALGVYLSVLSSILVVLALLSVAGLALVPARLNGVSFGLWPTPAKIALVMGVLSLITLIGVGLWALSRFARKLPLIVKRLDVSVDVARSWSTMTLSEALVADISLPVAWELARRARMLAGGSTAREVAGPGWPEGAKVVSEGGSLAEAFTNLPASKDLAQSLRAFEGEDGGTWGVSDAQVLHVFSQRLMSEVERGVESTLVWMPAVTVLTSGGLLLAWMWWVALPLLVS